MVPRTHFRLLEAVCAAFPEGAPRGRVLAAVSGGSDSMALLALLAAAREREHFDLAAVYVDHGVRAAAAFEAALVCATATKLGASFHYRCHSAPPAPSEEWFREVRYAALADVAEQWAADWIATGHTRDDQIETIVFRFLRGAGLGGLAGIPQTRGTIVRPLLELSRDELRELLRTSGMGWTEDASNRTPRYARNRLRNVVIPTIERELGRGHLDHLADVARVWRREDELLESEARRFAAYATRERAGAVELDLIALDSAPQALRPRVLREWLRRAGLEPEPGVVALAALERMCRSHEGSARVDLAGAVVIREYSTLLFTEANTAPRPFSFNVRTDAVAEYVDPAGTWSVRVDPAAHGEAPTAASVRAQVVEFLREALPGALELRSRAAGDAIRIGPHGRKKVHDIMVERRVPRRARDQWPVLATQDRVIWVPGLAVAGGMESACSPKNGERVRFAWRLLQS